jgi:hypothetical protein
MTAQRTISIVTTVRLSVLDLRWRTPRSASAWARAGSCCPTTARFKVAETFRVLSALHTDRIDLGVGRAAGTDSKTALALRQARELLGADDALRAASRSRHVAET